MRLTPDMVARIKACRGVYSVGDTARHFGISKSTVSDLWNNKRYTDVCAAPEPDNVITSRVPAAVVREEAHVLLQRGLNAEEVARTIGVARSTLYEHIGSVVVFT